MSTSGNEKRVQRAIQNLAKGETTKTDHRYLSLRVFWNESHKEKSAVLCRSHRNAKYRRHRDMWDSKEWFPAEACERCS